MPFASFRYLSGLTTEGSTKFKPEGWKCYLKKLQCTAGKILNSAVVSSQGIYLNSVDKRVIDFDAVGFGRSRDTHSFPI